MEFANILLIISFALSFYMAWNIGANDIANSMGSAVGAKAISLKQAIFIGSFLCLLGAVLVGGHVTSTIKKGIINTENITDIKILVNGLLATLAAAGLWVTFSTWKAWPVSTTHSIVGALVGFGLFAGGAETIAWHKLLQVMASWISSPLLAGIMAYILFKIIKNHILMSENSKKACLKIAPFFVGLTFLIVTLSVFFKTPIGEKLSLSLYANITITALITLLSIFAGYFLISYFMKYKKADVESIFKILQIITSCYVAFSIGTNDVANAIGPVAGIISIIKNQTVSATIQVPFYLLALGGVGISVGIMTWGYRVIATIGQKITELTNTRGFAIDFSTATSVLIASKLGMPVSTTHSVIGAVCGVGLARGLEALDLRVVKRIFISWVITLPASAFTAIIFFKLLNLIFG